MLLIVRWIPAMGALNLSLMGKYEDRIISVMLPVVVSSGQLFDFWIEKGIERKLPPALYELLCAEGSNAFHNKCKTISYMTTESRNEQMLLEKWLLFSGNIYFHALSYQNLIKIYLSHTYSNTVQQQWNAVLTAQPRHNEKILHQHKKWHTYKIL